VVSDGAGTSVGGAAARKGATGMTGRLAVALLVALTLFAFQLSHAQSSSAATGVPCPQTGNEVVATDQRSYEPGSLVHVTGMGYAPNCDVVVKITRPDGSVVTGDGSFAPGSDTVTTDLFGGLNYDYLLQSIPPVEGTYVIEVLGLSDTVLARMTFHDANNDANVAPGWAATNSTVTFSSLYRKTTGGTVQHVRITLPVGYSSISVAASAFSSGTWSAPTINQTNRTIDVQLTGGTGLATNNVDWARIDVTATTPTIPTGNNGNGSEWLMQTFTDTVGTAGEQNDNPPVLIGDVTDTSAAITFVDGSGNAIANPVFQNGIAATVRVRITGTGTKAGIKYTDVAVPTCFSSPSSVTATVSGGNPYGSVLVTDGFIRLGGGAINLGGSLTVQFSTTPNCTSGTYLVSSDPSQNASNPPSGTNQSVSTTGGSLTVAAGLADLSITKTDSPDPVARGGTLTYTIGVRNDGPDDASAVKVVDTIPANTTFVSATGTNWNCVNASGTVTCNRTGGNLAASADAPNITITVTAPPTTSTGTITISNSATVSSPNDNTPGNNTATASTVVSTPPSLTTPTLSPASPTTNITNLTASTTTSDVDGDQISVTCRPRSTRARATSSLSRPHPRTPPA